MWLSGHFFLHCPPGLWSSHSTLYSMLQAQLTPEQSSGLASLTTSHALPLTGDVSTVYE